MAWQDTLSKIQPGWDAQTAAAATVPKTANPNDGFHPGPAPGPTGFWGRIAQVGVGKVNLYNIHQKAANAPLVNANNSVVKNFGAGIVSAPLGLGKDINKTVVQPVLHNREQLVNNFKYGRPIVQHQNQIDVAVSQALKNKQIDPNTAPSFKSRDISVLQQAVAMKKAGKPQAEIDKMVKAAPIRQELVSENKENTRVGMEVLGTAALAYGGDSKFASATTNIVGDLANKLQQNPDMKAKDLVKGIPVDVALSVLPSAVSNAKGGVTSALTRRGVAKTDVTNVATNRLLEKGKQANTEAAVAKSLASPKTKLLPAGEKQPVKGKGFTMSPTADTTALSRGQQINQLQDKVTKFQQGKLNISPEEAKSNAQQLADLKSGKITVTPLSSVANKSISKTTSSAERVSTQNNDIASITGSAHAPNTTPSEETFKNIKTASAKSDAKGFMSAIHEWFNPVPGKEGTQVQRDLRTSIGGLTQQKVQSEALAKGATKEFGKLTPQEHLQFIQNVDKGQKQATPELDKLASVLNDFNKGNTEIAKSINPDLHEIENYTTHSGILDTGSSKSFTNAWSKAPFKGNPGSLKQRIFPTVGDMLQYANDKGIPVKETNPMTLALNSRASLLKTKMAQDFVDKQTAKGIDPAVVQKVVDRYMEPGISSSPVYKTIRQIGNAINNLQLGLSGFHVTGTSLNASFSEFSNGTNNLLSGHPLKAAASTVRGAYAPADYAVGGHKLIQDLVTGADNHFTQAAKIANFNPVKSSDYIANGLKKSIADFKAGHIIKGTLTLPGRAVSTLSKPIMEHWVPDLKAGAFKRAIQVADTKLGKEATDAERQTAYQKVADSIDNRFGQLNKDNLFWNKTLKDINTMGMRSPGWNIGTGREIGGGLKDIPSSFASLVKGKGISDRTAYTASLGAGTMLIGATLQKIFTGHGPTELIDYFYPKTGQTDKNGNAERVSLPTYSKDIFSFIHSPGSTFSNKTSPLLDLGKQAATNKDYFGNNIRNPADSFGKQVKQTAGFTAKNLVPFSLSNSTQRVQNTPASKTETFMGLNPAPSYITKSSFEQGVDAALSQSLGTKSLSPEAQALSQSKTSAKQSAATGNNAQIASLLKSGQITITQAKNLKSESTNSSLSNAFNTLLTANRPEAAKLLQKASPDDLNKLGNTSKMKLTLLKAAANKNDLPATRQASLQILKILKSKGR